MSLPECAAPTTSTGPTDPYPGATQTNDCANIFFSTVDLTGTIQVAGLNITASSGTPRCASPPSHWRRRECASA